MVPAGLKEVCAVDEHADPQVPLKEPGVCAASGLKLTLLPRLVEGSGLKLIDWLAFACVDLSGLKLIAWSLVIVRSGLKLIVCEPFVCCGACVSALEVSGLGSGLKLRLLWPGAGSVVATWVCGSEGVKLLLLRLALLPQLLALSEWSGLKFVTWEVPRESEPLCISRSGARVADWPLL